MNLATRAYIDALSHASGHPISTWNLPAIFGDITDRAEIRKRFNRERKLDSEIGVTPALPALDRYISRVKNIVNTTREKKLSSLRHARYRARTKLLDAQRVITTMSAQLLDLTAQAHAIRDADNSFEKFSDAIAQFAKTPGIAEMVCEPSRICFITCPVTLTNDDAAAPYTVPMGSYVIKLFLEPALEITVARQHAAFTAIHPYVSRSGHVCFGELAPAYTQAADEFDLLTMLKMTLNALHSWNSSAHPFTPLHVFHEAHLTVIRDEAENALSHAKKLSDEAENAF